MSKVRVRAYKKVGKGTYLTTSSSLGDTILGLCVLWFFRIFFIYPIKYLVYIPSKWCITKIIELIKNNVNANTNANSTEPVENNN